MTHKLSNRPLWFIFFEALGIILYIIIFSIGIIHLVRHDNSLSILEFTISFILGISSADILSGMIHYFADNVGNENTIILGPALIRPFREHHIFPDKMTKHDFIETNGALYLICAIILLVSFYFKFVLCYTLILTIFVANTNQIHKLAHLRSENKIVTLLRSLKLIITIQEHQKHHSKNLDTHYCITTGWFNKILFTSNK